MLEKNVLLPHVTVTGYRNREKNQLQYISEQHDLVYYTDIESLLNDMGVADTQQQKYTNF